MISSESQESAIPAWPKSATVFTEVQWWREEKTLGVISQTQSNMLRFKKKGRSLARVNLCLVRGQKKKKEKKRSGARIGQPCLASLPHGSDQEEMKRKSIGRKARGKKSRTSIRNEWKQCAIKTGK